MLVMLPVQEWNRFKNSYQAISELIREDIIRSDDVPVKIIITKKLMAAVRPGRTKFDQLVLTNKIRIIKKGARSIYPYHKPVRAIV